MDWESEVTQKHIAEAKAQGCELLGEGSGRHYRTYTLTCECEREVKLAHMRTGKFHCKTCLQDKHIAEAKAQGCELLGDGKHHDYRTYSLPCGCAQEVGTGDMRKGIFRCNTCEETYRTQPSNVYLLHIKNGSEEWLKLGYAKNVNTRINQYGLPPGSVVTDVVVTAFATGSDAREYEEALHAQFKSKKLSQKKAKELGMSNGFTECYPTHLINQLIEELQPTEEAA